MQTGDPSAAHRKSSYSMTNGRLCLIDANSLFYRAFYAIKAQLTTSSGQPTNAVFGFVKMVRRILEELKPAYLGVCFDVGKTTHRTEMFAQYKMQRPAMPGDLLSQVPYIKEVVAAYNFPIFEAPGYEADDVIASIVHRAAKKVEKVVIVSSDKDILQLVSDKVEVYNPYKEDGIVFTEDVVAERFGVEPQRIPDLISLMGDASDNIPGAKGIGEKTARELLAQFKSAEDLLSHVAKIKRESVKKIVEDNEASIKLSKKLAELRQDVPLEVKLADLKLRPADTDRLWEVFSRLEFKGMLKELSQERLSRSGPALDIPRQEVKDIGAISSKLGPTNPLAFFIAEEAPGQGVRGNVACDDEGVFEVVDTKALKELFSRPEILAVGHDVKASLRLLRRYGVPMGTRFFDTMIAAYLIESSRPARDPEVLIWDYLGLKGLSRLDYLGKEAHFLRNLWRVLDEKLRESGLTRLFQDVEMPLVAVLEDMEETGVALDAPHLEKLARDLDRKLRKLIDAIYEEGGCSFNINSPKQLGEVLFQKLKLPVVKKTKTGASTDEEVLTKLARDHALPRLLLDYRQATKLKTTYVDVLPTLIDKKTGRIHTTFNQTGTETGRLSSSNPNLQNIPVKTELGREIRRAFVPGAGYDSLLSADYSQIELRILAHLSEDEALLKAFRDGLDVHRHTASLIFGVAQEDVTEEMRTNAKRVNFGIIYGMSAFGLAKDLGIDGPTAQAFIDAYFLRYPKVKKYLDSQIVFVKEKGYVATLLGRRRYIPEINNPNPSIRQFAERQAINAPIQGSAADLIKMAMVAIHRRLARDGFRSRLILQVHDELVFEIKDAELKDLAQVVREGMEQVIALKAPIRTTIAVGKNWLETEEAEF